MKNGLSALTMLVACILALVAIAPSYAQDNNSAFDLAVTAIDSQPFAAGIGDETHYTVTFENLHKNPEPGQVVLDLILTVTDTQTESIVKKCRQTYRIDLVSAAKQPQRVPLADCSVVLQKPSTHLIRAEFAEPGQDPTNGAYQLIPGDLDAANNSTYTTIVPAVTQKASTLPSDITRIFAGLAIFFAVMALIAAGAEVVIDSLKVAAGLKRKVTSMDALERMDKYLPGELAALSVSAASRDQFRRMIREMRNSLGRSLQGAENLAILSAQISNGEFGPSFQRANRISSAQNTLSNKELYNFKKYLQAYVTNILNTLESRLHLPTVGIKPLRDQLAQEISLFDGEDPDDFLANLIDDLQDPHFWSSQIVDGWLSNRQEVFFDRSSTAIVDEFDNEFGPILLGIGFTPDSVESVRLEIISRLSVVESGISQSTDTFLTSIRNVLDSVELRRFETQSPARKAWRILRAWRGGSFPPTSLRTTFMPALYLAVFFLYLAWLRRLSDTPLLGGVLEKWFTELSSPPWFSWLVLFLLVAYIAVACLFLVRRRIGTNDKLWFIGLYGSSALSLLIGSIITVFAWVLQPDSMNRVSGQLQIIDWSQPIWSWILIHSLAVLALLMILSLIGKTIYDRLIQTAVNDGRNPSDNDLLAEATVIHRVETLWNLLRQGFDVTGVDPSRFHKADTVSDYEGGIRSTGDEPFIFSPETTAQFIMQRTDQQRDEETSRLRILRVISIAIGLVLAYTLQIDVLNLLGEAFPDVLGQLNWTIVSGETLHAWRNWLPVDKAITVGIVLTAFAASAGSAFWHDRLDQLQASRKGAQAAAQLLSQASQVADATNRKD